MKRFVDYWFKNRHTGKITIWQWPNLPLWGFLALTALGVVTDGGVHTVVSVLATVSLGAWAVFEITTGVNPFRRLMGAIVMVGLIVR